MLIKRRDLERILEGSIDLAFRCWKRPTVRPGGTLRTAVGVLAIDAVERVETDAITRSEARRAGFQSVERLREELQRRGDRAVYRIELHYAGPDPRESLRNQGHLTSEERGEIANKLERLDGASREGPWTSETLELIARRPEVRAAELARELGVETQWFKRNVRKLKNLGLTESLDVGYRLSPRGEVFRAGE